MLANSDKLSFAVSLKLRDKFFYFATSSIGGKVTNLEQFQFSPINTFALVFNISLLASQTKAIMNFDVFEKNLKDLKQRKYLKRSIKYNYRQRQISKGDLKLYYLLVLASRKTLWHQNIF